MNNITNYLFIFVLILFQSCVPNLPQYKNLPQEKIKIPSKFPNQNSQLKKTSDNIANQSWRLFFTDKNLVSLIEFALKNNQELNILEQQINIANNEVIYRRGLYLPKVDLKAGYDAERTSDFTSKGVSDQANKLAKNLNNHELQFQTTWEIDIWNKLRNFTKASYLEYLASIEGKRFATTQLIVEISDDYYELMSLDNQLEIITQFIETLSEAKKVAQLQQIAGRTTSLSVKRFEAELLKNQSRKYEIEQKITVTQNHLNQLLGRTSQKIERNSKEFNKISFPEISDTIPTDLLNNRPDLRQSYLELKAAKLNVKALKAQFYPSLNIDSNLGYQSFKASHFINSSTFAYDIAGNITAPLINRSAIKADYFSANNKQIEAIYNYEKTFINAFVEVANQLSAVKNLNQIYNLKSQQMTTLSESFEISNMLFKAARVDYLESLLTRRDYLESQLDLIEVKQRQLIAYVNLYKALGGGWRD